MIIPPIKTQGIKTKLLPHIANAMKWEGNGKWVEPFLGSGVVLFNLAPARALISDSNPHIIEFYQSLQDGTIDSGIVRDYLEDEGQNLFRLGQDHYYAVRSRFNEKPNSLDFLFLNRSCFNGMIRFNGSGGFNTPFYKKKDRFRKAYITKICNQVSAVETIMNKNEWEFSCLDWKIALKRVSRTDFVYADPPYINRFSNFYNCWGKDDADSLEEWLLNSPCQFVYSMWLENDYRKNENLIKNFSNFNILKVEHFYHLGAAERLRGRVVEALVVK